jgi:hypothetical protein
VPESVIYHNPAIASFFLLAIQPSYTAVRLYGGAPIVAAGGKLPVPATLPAECRAAPRKAEQTHLKAGGAEAEVGGYRRDCGLARHAGRPGPGVRWLSGPVTGRLEQVAACLAAPTPGCRCRW